MTDNLVIHLENPDGSVEKITTSSMFQGDNNIFLPLIASGYDCSNPVVNSWLASQGGLQTALYISLKQQSLSVEKEESHKQVRENSVLAEMVQPLTVHADTDSKIERVPLIGNLFWTGYKILLASDSGFGKSFFSIFLCILGFTRKVIRKACFFTLEDKDGEQAPRYAEMLKNHPVTIVSSRIFNKEMERLESKAEFDAGIDTFLYGNNPELKKWENAHNFALKKHGLTKKKISSRLLAFLGLLQEMIDRGHDFFVVDSLTEIFGNTNQLSRDLINAFLEIPSKASITFLVLHHVNGKDAFRGTKDLVSNFDSAYIMERVQEENTKGETLLRIRVEKKRYENEKPLLIQRNRLSKYSAEHKTIEEYASQPLTTAENRTFKDSILEFIRETGQKGCLFDDLVKAMKVLRTGTSGGSVQNRLRDLRKEGLIEAVGKAWHLIRAL